MRDDDADALYEREVAAWQTAYAPRPADNTLDRIAEVVRQIRPDLPTAACRDIARKVFAKWADEPADDTTMMAMLRALYVEAGRYGRLGTVTDAGRAAP